MFYAHLHPEHLKHAAGVIDSVLGTFLTNFLTTSAETDTRPGAVKSAQVGDTIQVLAVSSSLAGVAKLADARDSKSRLDYSKCGFNSLLRHQLN
jgi:hypothetical protein